MLRGRLHHLLLPLAAAVAILPLLLQGPSCGHDFDFHLLNWFEAAAQFRHGNLHPLWAVSPAFNAGEPRFLFYPPISWTLGALLGLILPWTWTPAAYTWIALTASGLAMHRLARAHAGPAASLLAATLYLANPYMLFTAYERTAYAELLAAAWLPLLLHAILKPRPTVPGIALPLALLWLTNAPAAVMGTYTLALLALIRLCYPCMPELHATEQPQSPSNNKKTLSSRPKRSEVERPPYFALHQPHPPHAPALTDQNTLSSRPERSEVEGPPHFALRPALALTTLAGTALGLALAAFYILPAATERPFVQIAMVILPGMRIADNTLFHQTGLTEDALAHDAVLHTASLIALCLLAATTLALLLARRSRPAIPLAILAAAIALLLTPPSLPLWRHLPELPFLQFPWRLLAVLATALGLAAALAFDRIRLKQIRATLTALALATALALPAAHLFRQPCDAPDTVPARLNQFQTNAGTEPTDEYTPAPADNDSLKPNSPPYWLAQDPDAPPPVATPGPAPRDLDLTSPIPQHLILNLRAYPDWRTTLNGRKALTDGPRADGLIALPIPAGPVHLHLAFLQSPGEHAADAISLIALLVLLTLLLRKPPPLDKATPQQGRRHLDLNWKVQS